MSNFSPKGTAFGGFFGDQASDPCPDLKGKNPCSNSPTKKPLPTSDSLLFNIWVFPKIGVPKMDGENNGDDLGVPLFLETPIYLRCFLKKKHPHLFSHLSLPCSCFS